MVHVQDIMSNIETSSNVVHVHGTLVRSSAYLLDSNIHPLNLKE